jgi:hypothetical protein
MLLAEFKSWSSTAEAVPFLHARFDEEVAKAIQKLPPQQRLQAATAIRHPAIREPLLRYLESNFSDWVGLLIDFVQSQGVVASATKDGQVRGLAKLLLDAGSAPDSFRPAAWHLLPSDDSRFVLGDGCVVTMAGDMSLGQLFKAGKDWREIYLPISPCQVLAATKAQASPSLDNAAINRASTRFALRYIYASSTGTELDDLQAIIGTGDPLLSESHAAQTIKKASTIVTEEASTVGRGG